MKEELAALDRRSRLKKGGFASPRIVDGKNYVIKSTLVAGDFQIDSWLSNIGLTQLCEWDALMFLSRHGTSLASAGQIALLLGYSRTEVGKALDNLVALKLVERSRASQGARLYRLAVTETDPDLLKLMNLSKNRSGRLEVAKRLRERARQVQSPSGAGLHLA